MATYVVVTIKSWNIANFKKLAAADSQHNWVLITEKNELTPERLAALNPRYIFFPHWSWIIPKNIFDVFECVVFHMADLPYGRGGSPLQNLIVRGHTATKISALHVGEGIDTGDIYMKEDLSLEGSAEEIFKRFSKIVFSKMIPNMIKNNPIQKKQSGEVVEFKRRKIEDGDISDLVDLEKIYDHIRMLDAEGYPNAFLEKGKIKLEFSEAEIKDGQLQAKVKIILNK